MAKKAKRLRRKATRTIVAETRQKQPAVTTEVAAARASASPKVDLAQEYHYVFVDLKRIAIIAAIMLALLFALSVVLR